jgi:ubiquinone biosynthesis protein
MAGPLVSRPIRFRQSVAGVLTHRQHRQAAATGAAVESTVFRAAETILQSMPRREQLIDPHVGQLSLPYIQSPVFKTSLWLSLRRLLTWFRVLGAVLLGYLFDLLLRRDTLQRQAVRLRRTLEHAGGTFVKLGQQAAMRIDLLPWAYCVELAKMLDRMSGFPAEQALEAVERTLHRPWQEIFEVFDPEPVGSASIACVYQATLQGGKKVVVKVRRPGIAELFMADLQVLDWIAGIAEFLTFLRPGFTRNLRADLRDTLMEELDFRREGHFQDTFRRNARKSGKNFFTAPCVYFEFSGDDVLVQEFVSGLWLWEVIAAVEQNDPKGCTLLRELHIDPAIIARRILWATFWSMDENVFFHADPHPANILIRPNNQVTFIDFGSCGSFNYQQRFALEQIVLSMKKQDVEAMVRASLNLMEPLPPIDVPALSKQVQGEYMRVLHTFNTPAQYTEYWERTTARLWLILIQAARKYNLPMNLHVLRMIRATLLYDSIVLRLDNQLDRYEEYAQFMNDRANFVKLRWREDLRDNSGDGFFLNLQEFGHTIDNLMIRAQTTVSRPIINFGSTVDKWIFAATVFTRMMGRILIVTILAIIAVQIKNYLTGGVISLINVLAAIVQNWLYLLFLVAAFVLNLSHILVRFQERDAVNRNQL